MYGNNLSSSPNKSEWTPILICVCVTVTSDFSKKVFTDLPQSRLTSNSIKILLDLKKLQDFFQFHNRLFHDEYYEVDSTTAIVGSINLF